MSTRRQSSQHAPARRQIILLAIICTGLGLCGVLTLGSALRVLTAYQPSVTGQTVAGPARAALTDRVVLVVVNRLSAGALSERGEPWRFVELRRRAAEGARGIARAVQPSGDLPTWAALLSGAGPEQSGAIDDTLHGPLPIPTLFDQARRAKMRSAVVAGPAAWQARASLAEPDKVVTARSSATVGAAAAELLQARTEPLVVVLLDAGKVEPGWPADSAGRIDAQLGAIAAALDPARDTLIVIGDHGVLADGSSGGHEGEVLDVPLVLWGRAVQPGVLGAADQRAIAPTIAALLGLPYAGGVAEPLLDGLDLDAEQRADQVISAAAARIAAHPAFVPSSALADATTRLDDARAARSQHDVEKARTAAEQSLALLVPPMTPPHYVTSAWTWSAGLPLILLIIAGLVGRFRHRLRFLWVPLIGLAAYSVLWALIFFGLAGKTISLSALYGDWYANLAQISLWSGLASCIVAVGISTVRARGGETHPALDIGWSMLLVLVCLASVVLIYVAVAGLPHDRLPGPAGWAALLIILAQLAGAGLATPVAMLLGTIIAEIASRGR